MEECVNKSTQQENRATPQEDVLTIDGLAKYLKVSNGWVYQNVNKIPHAKLGSLYRFHRNVINDWLANGGISAKPKTTTVKEIVDGVVKHVPGLQN